MEEITKQKSVMTIYVKKGRLNKRRERVQVFHPGGTVANCTLKKVEEVQKTGEGRIESGEVLLEVTN